MGGTPGRNFILDWGLKEGHERVWMLDDNIKEYNRLYHGIKTPIMSSVIFTHVEDYICRYDNVGSVGHNYNPLVREGDFRTCIVKNNKNYSSMCLPTNPEIRFRYKHQEDNLISIEFIEKGYCNLCFNSVVYDKNTSGQDGGGNKSSIYKCVKDKTDGEGYNERFNYFQAIVKILYWEGKITLREGFEIEKFVVRDNIHKSHEFHAKVHYEYLVNHKINVITKKENYEELVSQFQPSTWLLG